MTDLKPKIFIGSSGSGYEVAKQVKNEVQNFADCYLWKESGVWELNRSTFDNLLRMTGFFDFGVFVGTKDDFTLTSKGEIGLEARDNVILEMALFLGAIGKNKSFLLVETGLDMPTDFRGIYMPEFTVGDSVSIKAACSEIISKIDEHYQLGHFNLYPTTALAIGYYKNFVAGLVESAQEAETLENDNAKYTEFKLKVVMPKDLKGNIREKAAQFYKRHQFVESAMKTKFRRYPLWFQLDPKNAPNAIMYDMPSTLTGIDDAIEMILQKDYVGRSKMQDIIEQRELNNFRRVLQIQIYKSPFAESTVEIIDEF